MNPPGRVAVVIGCFALYHRGHHQLLQAALANADVVVVVLGSAFRARTPKTPFIIDERSAMIRLCIDEAGRDRMHFAPVRDYYDDERWSAAVRDAVAAIAPGAAQITLVLSARDDSARFLERFPKWQQLAVENPLPVDSARLRSIYLRGHEAAAEKSTGLDAALAVICEWVPAPMVQYLRAWAALPVFGELAGDQHAIDQMLDEWRGTPYEVQFITVDSVVRAADHVLLVRRGGPPGKGLRALPGGFIEPRETLLDGAIRELREETRLGILPTTLRRALKRVAVFDDPARSQRGRTVTHAHFFDLDTDALPQVKGGDDAADASWVAVSELSGMEDQFFEDHFHILDEFFRLT